MKNESRIEVIGIVAALGIIFLLWLFYPNFLSWMDHSSVSKSSTIVPHNFSEIGNKFGTYGDSYGSLNTLFSGFAFAILIISLFMQRQELKEQRKELEAQRNEIKESNAIAESQRKITEQQAKLIEQQIFDSKIQNFYQLLFKYLDEKNTKFQRLSYGINSSHSGNKVFVRFIELFNQNLLSYNQHEFTTMEFSELIIKIQEVVEKAEGISRNFIQNSGYFDYVYFIINFIDENTHLNVTTNAIDTLLAFQTFEENICMAIIGFEDENLREYIVKYSLLKKMNFADQEHPVIKILNLMYDDAAFG